ncbi:helix-turn-helix domain-containing protein [Avibacterium paragallinarum]|uniref:helix-turn-helix domain-containing protein n=1 Tax=Avibacterium paragallinarum TaxID=728 RepID=UPI00397DE309
MFNVPAYSLDYLADFVNLSDNPIFHYNDDVAEGRNCDLFNQIKRIGYREVLQFKKANKKLSQFSEYLLSLLEQLNQHQQPPLAYRELRGIAKSAARWIWERFSEAQFREIQSNRSKKRWKIQQQNKALFITQFNHNQPRMSPKQLAEKFNVSVSTIHRWLKEVRGIESKNQSKLMYERILVLRNQGLKWQEIAQQLAISIGCAKMCFKRNHQIL